MTSQHALGEVPDFALIAQLLVDYAASIPAADVEKHHYIPSIEAQAELLEAWNINRRLQSASSPVDGGLSGEELKLLNDLEEMSNIPMQGVGGKLLRQLIAIARRATPAAPSGVDDAITVARLREIEVLLGEFEAKVADFEDGSYRNETVRDLLRNIQALARSTP